METFFLKITQEHGIHARPAGQIVAIANQFRANIIISVEDSSKINFEDGSVIASGVIENYPDKRLADAKSIFGIMSLGIKHSDVISVACDGEDEQLACAAVKDFFINGLA